MKGETSFNKITDKGNLKKQIINGINGKLSTLNGIRDDLPVPSIDMLLRSFGLKLVQEDGTDFEVVLTGKDGRGTVLVADITTDKLINNKLVMDWHKYDTTSRFDFNCYLS